MSTGSANNMTWQTWSQKWGNWNAWFQSSVARASQPSNRPLLQADGLRLVMLKKPVENVRKRPTAQPSR